MTMMWQNGIKESWTSTQVNKELKQFYFVLILSVWLDLDYNYKPTFFFPTICESHVSLLLILFSFYLLYIALLAKNVLQKAI